MNNKIPQHVAIIMDGNGRWAKSRNLPLVAGHKQGAKTTIEITRAAHDLGIRWLTLYTFSTENWKRPTSWIADYTQLLQWYLDNEVKQLIENNVRLHIVGDIHVFASSLVQGIEDALQKTKHCTGFNLVLALNYGGRQEIMRAIHHIAHQVHEGNLHPSQIDEKTFANNLYTHDMPDPDLCIRTSGEQRISNFLLWQLSYSEFLFTPKLWPDYTADDFKQDVISYQSRERRFGEYK